MPARRHSLVINAITHGPLVILLAPDHFVRWTDHRKAMTTALREALGVKIRDIVAFQGIAGYPDKDPTDDPLFLARAKAAPADPAILPRFHFFEWREGRYIHVRSASD